MTDEVTTSSLSGLLKMRMEDKRTMIALGVAIFGLGIVIGSKLAGGMEPIELGTHQHRCLECEQQAEEIASYVAQASAKAADPIFLDDSFEPTVQPTELPPVSEIPE
jgi:hypothetical protein